MTPRGTFVAIKDRKNRDLTDAALKVKVSRGPVGHPNPGSSEEEQPPPKR